MRGRERAFALAAGVIVVAYAIVAFRFGGFLVSAGGPASTPGRPVGPVGAPQVAGTIAFVLRGDVFVLRAGSYVAQTSEGRALQPSLSADGATLIFSRTDQIDGARVVDGQLVPARLGYSSVWRKGSTGGPETALLTGLRQRAGNGQHQVSWYMGPALSPDGRQLAYTEDDGDGNADLAVIDLASRRVSVLSRGANLADPSWSADGRTIAVTTYTTGVPGILLVPTDGRAAATRVTGLPEGEAHHPSYSADGRWIVYTLRHDGRSDLHAYDPSAKQEIAITSDGHSWSGVFSPDGRSVAFLRDADLVVDLYAMELDTALTQAGGRPKQAVKLTHGEGVDGASRPAWGR